MSNLADKIIILLSNEDIYGAIQLLLSLDFKDADAKYKLINISGAWHAFLKARLCLSHIEQGHEKHRILQELFYVAAIYIKENKSLL